MGQILLIRFGGWGYICEVGEGCVAGVVGGERDKVGLEVSVAGEEGEMNNRAESWEGKGGKCHAFGL